MLITGQNILIEYCQKSDMPAALTIQQRLQQYLEKNVSTLPMHSKYRQVEGESLGEGCSGKIFRVTDIETGQIFACKQLLATSDSSREVTLHAVCSQACEYICSIKDVFLNKSTNLKNPQVQSNYYYLIMDCYKESLMDFIDRRFFTRQRQGDFNRIPCFSEQEASGIIKQLCYSLKYLHCGFGQETGERVAHRDLKPENILLPDGFEPCRTDKKLALTDFGFAKNEFFIVNGQELKSLKTANGTPGYVAPEVVYNDLRENNRYEVSVDIWSLGVIMYILLIDEAPFDDAPTPFKSLSLQNTIRQGHLSLDHPKFERISIMAKDLLRSMMQVDAKSRIGIEDILEHAWITNLNVDHPPAIRIQTPPNGTSMSYSNASMASPNVNWQQINSYLVSIRTPNDRPNGDEPVHDVTDAARQVNPVQLRLPLPSKVRKKRGTAPKRLHPDSNENVATKHSKTDK